MGTLNLGSSGRVTGGDAEFTGIVTKPAHPYLLCQSNTNIDVNNNVICCIRYHKRSICFF